MKFDRLIPPDERIILVIRRHPFAFVSSITTLLVMGILPVLVYLLLPATGLTFQKETVDWITVGTGTFYLFWITLGLVLWIDYYYDLYLITDQHIFDIDQSSLLSRRISQTSLARVQDVTARVKGFWPNLLDFGPITVQTAGDKEEIVLEDVPRPNEVGTTIMHLHDELIAKERRKTEVGEGEGVHPTGKTVEK
jgi:hypothetical protein